MPKDNVVHVCTSCKHVLPIMEDTDEGRAYLCKHPALVQFDVVNGRILGPYASEVRRRTPREQRGQCSYFERVPPVEKPTKELGFWQRFYEAHLKQVVLPSPYMK